MRRYSRKRDAGAILSENRNLGVGPLGTLSGGWARRRQGNPAMLDEPMRIEAPAPWWSRPCGWRGGSRPWSIESRLAISGIVGIENPHGTVSDRDHSGSLARFRGPMTRNRRSAGRAPVLAGPTQPASARPVGAERGSSTHSLDADGLRGDLIGVARKKFFGLTHAVDKP